MWFSEFSSFNSSIFGNGYSGRSTGLTILTSDKVRLDLMKDMYEDDSAVRWNKKGDRQL